MEKGVLNKSSLSRKFYQAVSLIFISHIFLHAQQAVPLDWKMHDVGQVRQLITNMGALWSAQTNYPGLIYCEFPPNSHEEHIGQAGIWIGAITPENDTLVSVTTSWSSSYEFFPSAASWDTIWVVNKGDTVDIPYWNDYTGVSDQDFVCRYNDYGPASLRASNHVPLYLDVIQTSYAWSSQPVDEMIVFRFYIIPTQIDLTDVYITYWLDGNVGYRGEGWSFAQNDYSIYDKDKKLGIAMDRLGSGEAYSPIGVKIYPPDTVPEDLLRWTFNWYPGGSGMESRDAPRYLQMAENKIMENQSEADGSQFMISFGPFDLPVGDTLHFTVGEILGEGLDGVLANIKQLDWLIGQNFKVPSPPPLPPLRVETKNHKVILRWEALDGDINPETYYDPYRADSVEMAFEGYRVYKSTQSATGPWNLLGEYDISDNIYGYNTGLEHEYIDVGLLNNLEYYYSVSAFSKLDSVSNFPSQESSINKNAKTAVPGTEPPETVGKVAVVPNPYRGDIAYHTYSPPWEKPGGTRARWMEQDRRIQFINLSAECEIKIYTLAGDLVNTIKHQDPYKGYEDWDLTSVVGQSVSSGIYLFTVEDTQNNKVQSGKFVIIK